jgi:hypothetical protein
VHYCALTVVEPAVNPDELAETTIEPTVPVERTMTNALPLNALRSVHIAGHRGSRLLRIG